VKLKLEVGFEPAIPGVSGYESPAQ